MYSGWGWSALLSHVHFLFVLKFPAAQTHFVAPLLSLCKKERGAKRSRASSGAEPLCHRTCPGLLRSFAFPHRILPLPRLWFNHCNCLGLEPQDVDIMLMPRLRYVDWPLRLQCLCHLSLLRCVSKGVRKMLPSE